MVQSASLARPLGAAVASAAAQLSAHHTRVAEGWSNFDQVKFAVRGDSAGNHNASPSMIGMLRIVAPV